MLPYRRFSLAERDRRWTAIRALMARDHLDAIVVPPNPGNQTDWQANARYISHCGGGLGTSVGVVFPLDGDVTVAAASARERWGPAIQDWVTDVRDTPRRYGDVLAERLLELHLESGRIGVCGLGFDTRTPEGTIFHGTYSALREALPNAEFLPASDLMQEVRRVKSQEEIDVLQLSTDLIAHAYEAEAHWAQPGVPDYVVWSQAMNAMFIRGSELAVHFNWRSGPNPSRTLTRPTMRPLERGDLIVQEIESSIIGYRAQQVQVVAVNDCDPIYHELAKIHSELYDELLAFLKPGITAGEIVEQTRIIGERIAPKTGPLAGARSTLIIHGRGQGDDGPLVMTGGNESTERSWNDPFPENGVYICKPAVATADRSHSFRWGDTVRTTAKGAVRMGTAPYGIVVSEPRKLEWPQP